MCIYLLTFLTMTGTFVWIRTLNCFVLLCWVLCNRAWRLSTVPTLKARNAVMLWNVAGVTEISPSRTYVLISIFSLLLYALSDGRLYYLSSAVNYRFTGTSEKPLIPISQPYPLPWHADNCITVAVCLTSLLCNCNTVLTSQICLLCMLFILIQKCLRSI